MKTPRLVHAGSNAEPWVLVRSGFWNFQTLGFFDGDEALVVDPGFFPEDIALLDALVCTRGRTQAERRVRHVVVTHAHHDHLRGWEAFPGAQVSMPRIGAEKSVEARQRILAAKAVLDKRLGIEDPTFRFPAPHRAFDQPTTLEVGRAKVVLFPLPGHSNCCSVAWIPSIATLYSADYLVSPGLPYCRWQMGAFLRALDWLANFCREERIDQVWPSHNLGLQGELAIQQAIARDREYLEVLEGACLEALAHGLDKEACIRAGAGAVAQWRGTNDRAAQLQNLDNAERMLAHCTDNPHSG